ncbi:MAG: hypothetical protein V1719_00840 [Patescibacteria group bacterium]
MERCPNTLPPPEKPPSESTDPIEDQSDPDACWDIPPIIRPGEKQLPNPSEEWPLPENPKL